MTLFLAGFLTVAIHDNSVKTISAQDFLTTLILFFGTLFVLAIATMVRWMFAAITDKAELKRRLMQQELMTNISLKFTMAEDPYKLINEVLKLSGELMKVNHTFLSCYEKDKSVLKCHYEWYDNKAMSFLGGEDKWPITPDMEIFKDLNKGYAAINDYNSLTHPNFTKVKDYNLGAFLNIPIEVYGKLWGVIGFIIYKTPYNWDKSDINFGRQIGSIFSGAISRNIANKELIKAKELAEQGNKTKSEFLSRMSHEMHTPMNAIIGMTKIAKDTQDIKRKDYCLKKIDSASVHLLDVINDILDMSKIEADKFELFCTEFNLKAMIEKVTNVISNQTGEKNQRFVLSVNENVPKIIKSDEKRLSQIISKLLNNAVKFTPNNGTITLSVRRLNNIKINRQQNENEICHLQFEIKDTGIGISQEKQNLLFKPFVQVDGSISRKYGGTGLGLAISKRIVEMMNGRISVKSDIGQGTSFIFDIQTEKAKANSAVEILAANEYYGITKEYPDDCFKHLKLLIAEDIEINREIIETLLEFSGISIDFAENGSIAYNLYSANPSAYNMIFMDIHMPEVNGYEATKMIRQLDNPRAKTIPIIAMTADVFHESVEKFMAVGMNGHLGKPLDINEVLKKIAWYEALAS
jgi:signal transduction histidine kinase/CheY-like chemotaxis protein